MEIQLNTAQWLELPSETRQKLINIFNIPKSEPTFISGGTSSRVISDGHNHKDLAVITVDKMQKYLGNYELTDFFALFGQVLNRIADEDKATVGDIIKRVETENLGKWLMVFKDIRDKAKEFGLTEQLKALLEEIFNVQSLESKPQKQTPQVNKGAKIKA
jgi:hypothetical protein